MKLTDFEEVRKLVEMKNGVENIDRSMIHFVISNPEYGGTRTTLDLSGFAEDVATFKHNLGVSIENKLRELGVDTSKPPRNLGRITATEVKEMEKEQTERVKAEWKSGDPAGIPDEMELDGQKYRKAGKDFKGGGKYHSPAKQVNPCKGPPHDNPDQWQIVDQTVDQVVQ